MILTGCSVTLTLHLQEEYKSLPRIKKKKELSKLFTSAKPRLEPSKATILKLRVQEEYEPLEQLLIVEKLKTPEEMEKEEREQAYKEMRAEISRLRVKHSRESRKLNLSISSLESREAEVCKDCMTPIRGTYNLLVDGILIEETAGLYIKMSYNFDPENWFHLCLYCNELRTEEMLWPQYRIWWRDLKKASKDRKAMKPGQDHRVPPFEVWRKALESSSLDRLESTLDIYRQE